MQTAVRTVVTREREREIEEKEGIRRRAVWRSGVERQGDARAEKGGE